MCVRERMCTVKAAVIAGPGNLEIIEAPIPGTGPNQALIKIKICGICASEYHLWRTGTDLGRPFGHEYVGVIVAVGDSVTKRRIGDRVTSRTYGAFAEYIVEHEDNLVAVPDELDAKEAMGEPLSCIISGALRTDVRPGDSVCIVGTGFMGLGFLQMMRAKGAVRVIAVDVRAEGLAHALHLGADEAYLPHEVPKADKVLFGELALFQNGVDVVVESSGSQAGLDLASDMVRAHGVLSIVGYHQSGVRNVDMRLWNWKAITVVNAHERRDWRHVDYIATAFRLIQAGRLNIKDMITHSYAFEDINAAFTALAEKPAGYIKGYVEIG